MKWSFFRDTELYNWELDVEPGPLASIYNLKEVGSVLYTSGYENYNFIREILCAVGFTFFLIPCIQGLDR